LPISYWQAIVLGLLQGFSELFPISSLGHSVILPQLLGWNIHQNDSYFITFLVATHLATALVLLGFFWSDWASDLPRPGRSLRDREIAPDDTDAKLGWLLVVGTIPAGLLGLLLEHKLRTVFASAQSASFFLMINGLLLFGAEALRRRAPQPEHGDPDGRVARRVSWRDAFGVGSIQAAALVPGISRSGVTMGGGLLVGLSNEDAARFAFLLGDSDHRRSSGPEAPGALRFARKRCSRPRTGRRTLRRRHCIFFRPLLDALLRNE
jgi:undecaprenyl-diphosphatase